MRYHVLACDYDGTLASGGRVSAESLAALVRVRESGRRLVLVTGRQIEDLLGVFEDASVFDWIVGENGGVLYNPKTRQERLLCETPPQALVSALAGAGVTPLSVGRAIVATWAPNEDIVLRSIRELGLEHHVIFNRGAVMVLPSGVNKATGLLAALEQLRVSPHNAVGIGDAENDHAFLAECECAVAVANAVPTLKERADLVMASGAGAGVVELADALVASDLSEAEERLRRHQLHIGTVGDAAVGLKPYNVNVLLAGASGSGKSTFVSAFLEQLRAARYQFCIVDPEGDYPSLEGAVVLGDEHHAPPVGELLDLLAAPEHNAVANLLGISLEHRPGYFQEFFPQLEQMRSQTGRPHWLVVDEAHHLLPAEWKPAHAIVPKHLHGLLLVTVHPDRLSRAVLADIDFVVAVGASPLATLAELAHALGERPPRLEIGPLEPGQAVGWWRHARFAPFVFQTVPPRAERRRHVRKYAQGELQPGESFYFRGAGGKLNLRAQNLAVFLQLAEGVDDETWLHHLRRHDYSTWFRAMIKDAGLAEAAQVVESDASLGSGESRRRIRALVEERYTAPA